MSSESARKCLYDPVDELWAHEIKNNNHDKGARSKDNPVAKNCGFIVFVNLSDVSSREEQIS